MLLYKFLIAVSAAQLLSACALYSEAVPLRRDEGFIRQPRCPTCTAALGGSPGPIYAPSYPRNTVYSYRPVRPSYEDDERINAYGDRCVSGRYCPMPLK